VKNRETIRRWIERDERRILAKAALRFRRIRVNQLKQTAWWKVWERRELKLQVSVWDDILCSFTAEEIADAQRALT
jgi:L-lactate utilization protein LutC